MKTAKHTLLIAILLLQVAAMQAQKPQQPNVEELHARKWQHMVENAQLTAKEIESVQPIFDEYEKALWKLYEKNRENFKKSKEEKPNFAELNEQFINQELKQAQLLKGYHQKLTKILAPEKLFNYYKAERTFKRKLLQNMPARQQERRNKK